MTPHTDLVTVKSNSPVNVAGLWQLTFARQQNNWCQAESDYGNGVMLNQITEMVICCNATSLGPHPFVYIEAPTRNCLQYNCAYKIDVIS